MHLSKRLMAICDLIPDGQKVIDIGADHAFADIYLNKYKNCQCLATDISKECIQKAKANIQKYNVNVQTMVTDGLNNLKLTDEIIIISGMGTKRIKKILTSDITNDLVISSHTKIPDLKKFLKNKHYKIVQEKHVSDKKTYTIIYAKKTILGKWLVKIKKKLKKNV